MTSQNSFGAAGKLRVAAGPMRFSVSRRSKRPAWKLLSHSLIRSRFFSKTCCALKTAHREAPDIEYVAAWDLAAAAREINFRPARVLLQDFTGVPCVVDLAAMRDALVKMGADPEKANPLIPVDLVIDHSVQVDQFGTKDAFAANALLEFQRNRERYAFLRWGQSAFQNFRAVPPDTGIVHQVNLEYLASGGVRSRMAPRIPIPWSAPTPTPP